MDTKTTARKVYDTMMSTDYCSQWMGVELLEIAEGYCKISMQVKQEMLNGYGILHGGIAYAFADSAFAFASNSYNRVAVSIQGSMTFSGSAREGERLVAEAKLLNLSHKTGEFDVEIVNAKNETLYRFRGIVYRKSDQVFETE